MSATDPSVCPCCGQALMNQDAVEQLRENHARQQRELQKKIADGASVLVEQRMAIERARLERDAARAQDKRVKALESTLKRVQEENVQLERRVQKLTPNERGEFQEVDIYDQLLAAFPRDRIERGGKGADILHTVYSEAGRTPQRAGVIVYECKDTIRWENGFIKQIQTAGAARRTPYLILVSRAYPKGEKTFCVRDGVIVVQPVHVRPIAEIIRRMVIEAHRAGLTADRRDEKTARLFEYLTSDDFRQTFGAIVGASDALKSFLSEERRGHERVWTRREQAYDDLARKSSVVDEAIRAITEEVPQRNGKVIRLPSRAKAG